MNIGLSRYPGKCHLYKSEPAVVHSYTRPMIVDFLLIHSGYSQEVHGTAVTAQRRSKDQVMNYEEIKG